MGEMLLSAAIKSFMGNVIAFIFWAGWASTGIDWFKTLGYISLFITIGYNSYKWIKELRADIATGKKKIPFRKRKN